MPFKHLPRWLLSLSFFVVACEGSVEQPTKFTPSQIETAELLTGQTGSADESGGGVFLTTAETPVRVNVDGERLTLAEHPANKVAVGAVKHVVRASNTSTLLVASGGYFIAENGWIVAPTWRGSLNPGGFVSSATDWNGTLWIAHSSGLFRLADGALTELKSNDKSIEGISSIAVGLAEDGTAGIWFAQKENLSVITSPAWNQFSIRSVKSIGGLKSIASVSSDTSLNGELWVTASKSLFHLAAEGWLETRWNSPIDQILGAGRFMWLRSGKKLYRYDSAFRKWYEATQLPDGDTVIHAVDASGAAWVSIGSKHLCLNLGRVPRVIGLFDSSRITTSSLVIQANVTKSPTPESIRFSIGHSAENTMKAPSYSAGGLNEDGSLKPLSLEGLSPGKQTLTIIANYTGGETAARHVYFDYQPSSATQLGYEKDILPIFTARCANCHVNGPGRALNTYDLWKSQANLITKAIVDARMPADGPLDASQSLIIQRWVEQGTKP